MVYTTTQDFRSKNFNFNHIIIRKDKRFGLKLGYLQYYKITNLELIQIRHIIYYRNII